VRAHACECGQILREMQKRFIALSQHSLHVIFLRRYGKGDKGFLMNVHTDFFFKIEIRCFGCAKYNFWLYCPGVFEDEDQ
jgi:hypothetical protein